MDGKRIEFPAVTAQTERMSLFLIVLTFFFGAYAEFSKDARTVTWRGQKLKGIEPSSFQPTCPAEILERKGEALFCAIDAQYFYWGVRKEASKDFRIERLPRGPVKELGKNHFQISKMVFYKSLAHPLPNADFATFDELEEEIESGIDSRRQWASDHRDVYCAGRVVTGLSPRELAFWPFLSWDCKDLVSSQIGNLPLTGYIKDADGVFLYVDCKLHLRVQEADPASFTVPNILFPSRARDGKGHIYNCGHLVKKKR